MNLKQMEYFTTIVNSGSISAAAKALHISQPPLSMQMKLLEEELGITLFERGSRSILLTEGGKLFFERASDILEMTGGLKQEMEQLGKGLKGSLRLGMISSVETEAVIGHTAAFRKLHPEVNFLIYEGNTYQLLDKLDTGIIEAAIVRTPFPEGSYECLSLGSEPMMAVGREEFFPSSSVDGVSLESLSSCPLIIYRRWENVLKHSFSHNPPDYLCINDDARTSLAWAKAGAGIAIVPASIAGCSSQGISVKPILDPGLESRITLICRRHSSSSSIVREFFSFWNAL
ncbi:LysR family transcriptional regulator [Lacrimispora sp. 210928-DFI.3.58]|uniref:LysR family transcriptional regulator n=1 Tax=Lacrimispora sp. 210928-DFI.3.58 TaxID=2883214 RepID=UPI0015B4016D|nr:LysR family transcriptional regulator [Lacrimispora sp. 210928-DFI.3.58]MCB7318300.1 LysR family transcriptional regulator [Lacrimispora sp. 210928-DFI.3.58]